RYRNVTGVQTCALPIYYFFPTKEDLLLAVLAWYKANLWPQVVEPVFQRVGDPIERIFGILDGYRQGLLYTRFEQGCPVGNLALRSEERRVGKECRVRGS